MTISEDRTKLNILKMISKIWAEDASMSFGEIVALVCESFDSHIDGVSDKEMLKSMRGLYNDMTRDS